MACNSILEAVFKTEHFLDISSKYSIISMCESRFGTTGRHLGPRFDKIRESESKYNAITLGD